MNAELDVIGVAGRVAEAIESVGGRYFVGGSLASSVDGEPRPTNDIDFVVDLPLGRVEALTAALGADFEVDQGMLREALLRGSCANAFYLPIVLKIDLFGHAHGAYDNVEFDRRRLVEVRAGTSLYVKSPEDSVLRKLLWFRAGGEVSDRQWRDVLGILVSLRIPFWNRTRAGSWPKRLPTASELRSEASNIPCRQSGRSSKMIPPPQNISMRRVSLQPESIESSRRVSWIPPWQPR